jgi:hypothetical protein
MPILEGMVKDVPEQTIVSYPCIGATAKESAALRIAAAAWEAELRKTGRAYAEAVPGGPLRLVSIGANDAALTRSRDMLYQELTESEFKQARSMAGAKANQFRAFVASYGDPQKAKDAKACTRIMLQSAIDRLRFEAEGGSDFLTELEKLTAADVATAAKKHLSSESEKRRTINP